MSDKPTPPPLDQDYHLPQGGIRQDRSTGKWFADFYDRKTGLVERGPYDTREDARAVLTGLMGEQKTEGRAGQG